MTLKTGVMDAENSVLHYRNISFFKDVFKLETAVLNFIFK